MDSNLLAQNLMQIAGQAGVGITTVTTGGLPFVFSRVIPYITYISAFLLLIYLLTGGLQLMFSRGDPKAIAMAQVKITNALIGFLIVILAYFLTSLIGEILGIKGFGGTIQ